MTSQNSEISKRGVRDSSEGSKVIVPSEPCDDEANPFSDYYEIVEEAEAVLASSSTQCHQEGQRDPDAHRTDLHVDHSVGNNGRRPVERSVEQSVEHRCDNKPVDISSSTVRQRLKYGVPEYTFAKLTVRSSVKEFALIGVLSTGGAMSAGPLAAYLQGQRDGSRQEK